MRFPGIMIAYSEIEVMRDRRMEWCYSLLTVIKATRFIRLEKATIHYSEIRQTSSESPYLVAKPGLQSVKHRIRLS